ncbi:MAG: SGNH/GDSL hydrolase family protein [Nitrospina sp.]|nr:SGNH/GDSL hydrolase family protein [Nitrospina sp.]
MSSATTDKLESRASTLSLKKKLLFSLIPILLFLGGLEGILRVTVGLKQLRYKCHYPLLDNQYCPNVVAVKDTNGETIHTNSDGLLDREYDKTPLAGTFRVAVLGDSFTAGEEVKDGHEFHALWEEELTRRFQHPVEFINFGVGGIGPWKELQTYHLRAREYKPDLTVLAMYWENDFDNSYSKFMRGEPNPLKDEYPVESFLEQAQVIRKSFNQWLWNNVSLYQFTHTRYHMLEHQFHQWFRPEWREVPDQVRPAPETPSPTAQPVSLEDIDNDLIKKYPPLPGIPPKSRPKDNLETSLDDPWFFDSDAWDLIRKLLLKLKQEVEADGGRLVVMHFLAEYQYRERHDMPMDEFNDFLKKNGIGVIDPNPVFLKMSADELHAQYVPGDIHFNEAGNKKLADFSMDYLEQFIRKMKQEKASGQ